MVIWMQNENNTKTKKERRGNTQPVKKQPKTTNTHTQKTEQIIEKRK